jgi:hypothetical protein
MLNLCGEVVGLCEKYYGFLPHQELSGRYPLLLEYEATMRQRLEERRDALVFKKPSVLLFNKRYVFNNQQLRVYTPAVSSESDLICLAIFLCRPRKSELVFTHLHMITRSQWDLASISNEHYKAFDLTQTLVIPLMKMTVESSSPPPKLSLSSSSTLSCSSSSLASSLEMSIDMPFPKQDERSQFTLFWIHEQLNKEEDVGVGSLQQYIQFVIDVFAWQRFLHKSEHVKQKMVRHYAQLIKNQHSRLALLFLHQMIEMSSDAMTAENMSKRKEASEGEIFYDSIAALFLHEWIACEVFLFHHFQWYREREAIHRALHEHVIFMATALSPALLPAWFDYTIDEEGREFWQETSEHTYKLKSEWLYKQEFEKLLTDQPIQQGYIYISEVLFATLFLPSLYRCVLTSVHHYLYFIHHSGPLKFIKERRLLSSYSSSYTKEELTSLYTLLASHKLQSQTTLLECAEKLGDLSTPVLRHLLKIKQKQQEKEEGTVAFVPWYEKKVQRDMLPDLEDLGKGDLLPPCLKEVFGKEHIGNMDRVNVSRYLMDLAYSKEEVVEFLCKGADRQYTHAVSSTYDHFYNKQKKNNNTQTKCQSFGCSSIINMGPQGDKNIFRCHFEAKTNGAVRRKNHDINDKREFMTACRASLTLNAPSEDYIQHPVHYVLLQLQK